MYDNYRFFVVGYCTTPRASDCIVSIAVRAMILTAIAHAEPPLPASGVGGTVIQSVSAKQRLRRASTAARKRRTP